MAPRGGKSVRSKKQAVAGRPPKRPKGCHPGITIEPVTGPAPKYRQRIIVDPAPTPSTSATDKSSPVPTDQSTASLPRGSTPTQSTASRSSPPTGGSQHSSDVRHRSTAPADEYSDSSDNGDGDTVANEVDGSDAIGLDSSGSVPVRGADRPISPRRPGAKKLIATLYMGKLIGDGVPRFFGKQIKRNMEAFWKNYSEIGQDVKDKIWSSFLDIYDVVGGPVALARQVWESENQKKFSDLLTKTRKKALKDNKVEDVALLLGKPCPKWLTDPAIWEEYVRYWCREDQRAISAQACLNRRSSAGRPDGMLSVHALGSKSIQDRMFEKERQTGKTPSALPILHELNKKKDKVTNEATGDVYNPNLEMAYTQYDAMFHERYRQDVDPLQQPWDKRLWLQTAPVKAGLGKGRVLGAGPSLVAKQMLLSPCPSNIAPGSTDEELSRKYEAVEARNKALEEKLLEMEMQNKTLTTTLEVFGQERQSLKEEVVSVKGELANLTSLVKAYMAGEAAAGQGSMCSIPSVGSAVTATGLLASMHPFTPPEPQVPTPQSDPPHSSFPESQP